MVTSGSRSYFGEAAGAYSQGVADGAAAERERLYAAFGNDHYVIFTEDGWTVEHSAECRLSGHMHECGYLVVVRKIAGESGPDLLGRWRISGIDSGGLPQLDRADR